MIQRFNYTADIPQWYKGDIQNSARECPLLGFGVRLRKRPAGEEAQGRVENLRFAKGPGLIFSEPSGVRLLHKTDIEKLPLNVFGALPR